MDSDYTCFCTGLTERKIKNYFYKGVGTVDEMCTMTRAGRKCSSCRPRIDRLLGLTNID